MLYRTSSLLDSTNLIIIFDKWVLSLFAELSKQANKLATFLLGYLQSYFSALHTLLKRILIFSNLEKHLQKNHFDIPHISVQEIQTQISLKSFESSQFCQNFLCTKLLTEESIFEQLDGSLCNEISNNPEQKSHGP